MLYVTATQNLSGFAIWGSTSALMQLRELMGNLLEDNLFFKHQGLIDELFSIPYEIRKAYEGCRYIEKHNDFQDNEYSLYGTECILPLMLVLTAMLRQAMSFNDNNKSQLAIMYLFEFQIEEAIKKHFPKTADEIINLLPCIATLQQERLFKLMPSRCNYFLTLKTKSKKEKLLLPILKSFLPYYKNAKLDFSCNEYPDQFEW
ncbi:hypothetical protein KRX11_06255 [Pasteurellaceae bacterium TAE3-ERU1]|nr:hypothetical protein [Pasteurellaceae bacterium TAE3-ERU1]